MPAFHSFWAPFMHTLLAGILHQDTLGAEIFTPFYVESPTDYFVFSQQTLNYQANTVVSSDVAVSKHS